MLASLALPPRPRSPPPPPPPRYQVNKKEERVVVDPITEAIKIYDGLGNKKQAASARYQRGLFYSSTWKHQKNQDETQAKLRAAMADLATAEDFFKTAVGEEATHCRVLLALSDLFDMMGANSTTNLQLAAKSAEVLLAAAPGFSEERDGEIRRLVGFVATAKLSEASAGEKEYSVWRKGVEETSGLVEAALGKYLAKAAKAEKTGGGGGEKWKSGLRTFLLFKQRKITAEPEAAEDAVYALSSLMKSVKAATT